MWYNDTTQRSIIGGSCSRFACQCCRTKYGYPHQRWCDVCSLTQPTCRDCVYYNEKSGVCRHPAAKNERKEVGANEKDQCPVCCG